MEAITREEKILSGEGLKPITRKEMFLAAAAGQNVTLPEPITREEMFLSKIQPGGGGGDALKGLIDGSITEISNSDVTKVNVLAFSNCANLTSVNFPNVTTVGRQAFESTGLLEFSMPKVESFGNNAFQNAKFVRVTVPASTRNIGIGMFKGNSLLEECHLLFAVNSFNGQDLFYNCPKLKAVIIPSPNLIALGGKSNMFGAVSGQTSPIDSGQCHIYVPSALIDSYKTATNWSVFADSFRAIEGSEYE